MDYYDSETDALGNVGVLAVAGETDLYTAPRFRSDLDEVMEMVSGDVVLDLSALELVDSTALGLLMAALARMMEQRRSLVLVIARPHVRRVFAITGLDAFFSIVPTLEDAMAEANAAEWSRLIA